MHGPPLTYGIVPTYDTNRYPPNLLLSLYAVQYLRPCRGRGTVRWVTGGSRAGPSEPRAQCPVPRPTVTDSILPYLLLVSLERDRERERSASWRELVRLRYRRVLGPRPRHTHPRVALTPRCPILAPPCLARVFRQEDPDIECCPQKKHAKSGMYDHAYFRFGAVERARV